MYIRVYHQAFRNFRHLVNKTRRELYLPYFKKRKTVTEFCGTKKKKYLILIQSHHQRTWLCCQMAKSTRKIGRFTFRFMPNSCRDGSMFSPDGNFTSSMEVNLFIAPFLPTAIHLLSICPNRSAHSRPLPGTAKSGAIPRPGPPDPPGSVLLQRHQRILLSDGHANSSGRRRVE